MVDVVDELRHGSEAECKCFRCRAADEIERLRKNLNGRDDFIGAHGLWDEFVQSLPRK